MRVLLITCPNQVHIYTDSECSVKELVKIECTCKSNWVVITTGCQKTVSKAQWRRCRVLTEQPLGMSVSSGQVLKEGWLVLTGCACSARQAVYQGGHGRAECGRTGRCDVNAQQTGEHRELIIAHVGWDCIYCFHPLFQNHSWED